MKTVKTFIERGNDGNYSVYVDLEDKTLNYGIHGTGKTAKEAVNDFMSAYETMKALHQQKKKEFVEAHFEFVYDVIYLKKQLINKFFLYICTWIHFEFA